MRDLSITIYPAFNIYYYSYYLQGLWSTVGKKNITYSAHGFPSFGSDCLAFVVHSMPERRIYISAGDGTGYNPEGLEWCDIYAKVNIAPNSVPENYASKVMAIGPGFGLRVYSPLLAVYEALRTLSFDRGKRGAREHFVNYLRQFKNRLPEHVYEPGVSTSDYIFFAGSLWEKEIETTSARALFIEACQAIAEVQFEGGFAPRKGTQGFEHLMAPRRYSLSEYLQKTKASALVFNTPAVLRCHGWKLGEFLALGKAIVSTPLMRLMPAPLLHGEHVHYVEASLESIRNAIQLICQDGAYRKKLERGAREYYLTYLSPTSVIGRIVKAAESAG